MACYSLNVRIISRGKGSSIASAVSYISGSRLHDVYNSRCYSHQRHDVVTRGILLPGSAPTRFQELQTLIDELNTSERRKDSQLAQHFKLALPNELTPSEQLDLVKEFCEQNFIAKGRCVVYGIHRGEYDPEKHSFDIPPISERLDNPHAHLIVPFRSVDSSGFLPTKLESRSSSPVSELISWRKNWADTQNRAFERLGLDVRVSHESLESQGIKRSPEIHLGYAAMSQELQEDPSLRGDRYLSILSENQTSRAAKNAIEALLKSRQVLRAQKEVRKTRQRQIHEALQHQMYEVLQRQMWKAPQYQKRKSLRFRCKEHAPHSRER